MYQIDLGDYNQKALNLSLPSTTRSNTICGLNDCESTNLGENKEIIRSLITHQLILFNFNICNYNRLQKLENC